LTRRSADSAGREQLVRSHGEAPLVFEELEAAAPAAREPALLAALSPGSYLAEEFRVLRAKVRVIAQRTPFRCIGLVSAAPGEGKTTVALGLAASMAQEPERRVLLVEADLRKRSIAGYLGLEPTRGLSEWLQGDAADAVPVRRLGPAGPYLLAGGLSSPDTPERIAPARVAQLLEAGRRCFDDVVVDCPPLTPVADSVLLQEALDGLLVVVRARSTPRETLVRALSHLNPARVHGLVFNDYREYFTHVYRYPHRPYGDD